MRNERGEAILFCVLILVVLSGLLSVCGLELQHNFRLMKKRTNLFLCVKETKGELNNYLKMMGRLNWLLKNTAKAQLVAAFFPPLWPVIGNVEKIKKVAKTIQATALGRYQLKLMKLKAKGCPIGPHILINPYKLGNDFGFQRTMDGAARLRSRTWTYYFLDRPYLLGLKVNATKVDAITPKLSFQAEEKGAILSSLLSSQ